MCKLSILPGWALVVVLHFLVPPTLRAQTAECCLNAPDHLTDYTHTQWNVEEEFTQSTIRSIIQTKDGHLWLGTQDGILEYNGSFFRLVRPGKEFQGDEQVNILFETRAGDVLAGTNKGMYKKRGDTFARFADIVGRVSAIAEERSGTLWFSTTTSGIYKCVNRECVNMQDRIVQDQSVTVHAMRITDSFLFLGTSAGLIRFDLQKEEVASFLSDAVVRTLERRSSNSFFLGTNKGLFTYTNGQVEEAFPHLPETRKDIWTIYQKRSSVFLGTNTQGFLRVIDGRIESFAADNPLSSAKIYDIFEDQEGSIWIGTEGSGLHRIRSGPFKTFHEGSVLGLYADKERLYIGTEGQGIVVVDDKSKTVYDASHGLSGNVVTSFAGSASDSLWIGTLDGGLSILHKGKVRPFSRNAALGTRGVYSLYLDSKGAVWIGTDNGVYIYRNKRLEAHPGKPAKNITAFYETKNGTWVGTYDQGLFLYQRGAFAPVISADELKADIILSLYESENEELWIGTYENGLFKYDFGSLVGYTTKDGLPTNTAFQIINDEKGDLWIGSNQGIYRLKQDQVDLYEAGRVDKLPSYLLNQAAGIKTPEVNGGFQPAGVLFNNQVFFPTINGVLYFDPAVMDSESIPVDVEITEILVDGSVYTGDTIEIPAHTQRIVIRYNPITFVGNDEMLIRRSVSHSMNSNWSRPIKERELVLAKPSGTFFVELQALNHQGVWGKTTILTVETIVPFYKTAWFWIVTTLGGSLLVSAIIIVRYRSIQNRQESLERAVQERTAELDNAKTRIEQQAAALQQSLSEKDILLKEIHHRVRNNLQVISGLLYLQSNRIEDEEILKLFRQSEARIEAIAVVHEKLYASGNVESINVSEYLSDLVRLVASSYEADERGIQFSVQCDEAVIKPDIATSIGLIVNELVSNVFKHAFDDTIAGHRFVNVTFIKNEEAYVLSVIDNGKGIDPGYNPDTTRSLGLKIIHAFCDKLNADFSFESSERTTFTVTIPAEVLCEQTDLTH